MRQATARLSRAAAVLTALTLALSILAVVAVVAPPRTGALGLALVFELQLFGVALVGGVPVAIASRSRLLGAALVVAVVVASARFGSEIVSFPPDAPADLTVLTWNLERGSRSGSSAVTDLRAVDVQVDVIALQELEPAVADAIAADGWLGARFPYRILLPRDDTRGLGVLSRTPLRQPAFLVDPAFVEVMVERPAGRVTLIDAHPLPLLLGGDVGPLPLPFNAEARDAHLARIRTAADSAIDRDERVLLVGDFNTSPSEPGYALLSHDLRDTHVEVGVGPGWTWRPSPLAVLPIAFLRLDLQLSGGGLEPVSTRTDCSHAGDHCQLYGGYRTR